MRGALASEIDQLSRCGPGGVGGGGEEDNLVARRIRSDEDLDLALIRLLRQAISVHIRSDPDRLSSEGGLTYSGTMAAEGVDNVDVYCADVVERMGEDARGVTHLALSNALDLRVRIIYLDRAAGADLLAHDFPDDGAERDVTVLLKPGHYDILYERPRWGCPSCTTRNSPTRRVCEACGRSNESMVHRFTPGDRIMLMPKKKGKKKKGKAPATMPGYVVEYVNGGGGVIVNLDKWDDPMKMSKPVQESQLSPYAAGSGDSKVVRPKVAAPAAPRQGQPPGRGGGGGGGGGG